LALTSRMFIVTGDETGFVKLVDVTNRTYLRYGDEQSRAEGVTGLLWMKNLNMILSTQRSGVVNAYTLDNSDDQASLNKVMSTRTDIVDPSGITQIIGSGVGTEKVLLYNCAGSVALYSLNSERASSGLAVATKFSVKGPVAAVTVCDGGFALFGGKENDAKLYDIETQAEIWTAKNVSQDKLHLRVPVWITCLAFKNSYLTPDLSDGGSAESAGTGNTFYSGTAYRHVRMYDMKASRQPVVSFELGDDFRVSAIQPGISSVGSNSNSEHLLYISDTTGGLTQWDVRMRRRLHTMKGAAGCIRQLRLSSDGKHLACVGLDRFLRVYDTASHKLLSSVYLKNRLNACAFVGHGEEAAAAVATTRTSSSSSRKLKEKRGKRVENDQDEDLLQELSDGDESGSASSSGDEEAEEEEEDEEEEEEAAHSSVDEEVEVEEESGSDDENDSEEEDDDDEDEEEEDNEDDSADHVYTAKANSSMLSNKRQNQQISSASRKVRK
jgi:hypothetical protein